MFSVLSTSLVLLAAARAAVAHVDINFPLGQWNFTEEQQETGAFCGGGSAGTPWAWGTEEAFVSLSGDPGQQITVKFATNNSTDLNFAPKSESEFTVTLLEGVTFGESGNFCANITIPNASNLVAGAAGIVYVEVSDTNSDDSVSSCANTVLVPNQSIGSQPVVDSEGHPVLDSNDEPYNFLSYYCSNSTIPARSTCDCHCHGTEAHCTEGCSADQVAHGTESCAVGEDPEDHDEGAGSDDTGPCDCHCHGDHAHCSGKCSDAEELQANNQCATSAGSATSAPTSVPTDAAFTPSIVVSSFVFTALSAGIVLV